MSLRIAHLSDLHASQAKEEALPIIGAALDDLESAHSEKSIDLVVFSGDLADKGRTSDYEAAHSRLIEPLIARLGIDVHQLVLVPGNHDIDRTKIDRYQEGGLQAELRNPSHLELLLNDTGALARATERLEAWNQYYQELTEDLDDVEVLGLAYTRINQVRGIRVGIASLNSAWRSSGEEDKSKLLLGESQFQPALRNIRDCDLRIVAMHHPLTWLADFDGNSARAAFEGSRSLVLTGHEHRPDPTSEFSLRGAAVYSRAGCLYEKPKSLNGFTLIDVDLESGSIEFRLRTWYPEPRNEFDQATGLARGGLFTIQWKEDSSVPVKADYSAVLDGLTNRAVDLCVLASPERALEVSAPDDVLVEPRLWPVPYKEIAAARNLEGSVEPELSEPLEVLDDAGVLVVSGEPESGVSGTLLWLLARHFELRGTFTPVQIDLGKKLNEKRFDKGLKAKLREIGQSFNENQRLPPLLLAIDDLTSESDLSGLARYVSKNSANRYILGTHETDRECLEAELQEKGVEFRSLHLGPLGRAQVRKLIEMNGGLSDRDVDRIFGVVVNQHLPRTPLLIAALIVVLQGEQDPTAFNPSALLDGCVKVLLTMELPADPLDMDLRQREVLLSWLAGQMARSGDTRLTPLEADEVLARYFRDRGLSEWQTPGQAIESHVARRILVKDSRGIGFRHQALRDLFAGKRITDEPEFAVEALKAPLQYEKPIRHAAGIRRNDKSLLVSIQGQAGEFLERVADDFDVELFDRIKDRQGWSNEDPDLDQLKAAIAERDVEGDVDESEHDEQLDRLYDDVEYDEEVRASPERLRELGPYVSLLAGVLRNSELVDDVELKEKAFRAAIHGWSMIAIVFAVEEDQSADVRERLGSEIVQEMAEVGGDDKDDASLERLTELILVMLMVMSVTSSLASPHLEVVAQKVLDDDEFMDATAHALFSTLFYALMRFKNWVDRVVALYQLHGEHPIVKELCLSISISAYRSPGISDQEADKLGAFLAGLTDQVAPKGSGGIGRGIVTDSKLKQLRESRQQALMADALRGDSADEMPD